MAAVTGRNDAIVEAVSALGVDVNKCQRLVIDIPVRWTGEDLRPVRGGRDGAQHREVPRN